MSTTFRIPVGGQHIALLEPLRFELETENEKVVGVNADVGYVHRGVEKACTTKFNFKQVPYVVSRVCGLCAVTHATCYSLAVERMMGVEVPRRGQYLRVLALELDRIQSHLLCLAHTAENAGFEALFMTCMRLRETAMSMHEVLTGNRVQVDYCCVGGVNRDLSATMSATLKSHTEEVGRRIDELYEWFCDNPTMTVKHKGVAVLEAEDAYRLNVVGPFARGAGIPFDIRSESTNPLPYGELAFKPVVEQRGDVWSRNRVRLGELRVSCDMVLAILRGLPEGGIAVEVKGRPDGEASMRLEAPRGELYYYVRGGKQPILARVRIKTPTFSNIPAMIQMLKGVQYTNVPTVIASYDPCLSCTAR
jgi:ech hydrogenase subunit E